MAGSLQQAHLPVLKRLPPDVIGVRGALCQQGDRSTGIVLARVRAFMQAAQSPALAAVAQEMNHA